MKPVKPKLTKHPMTEEDALSLKRFGGNHDYVFRNIGELRESYLNQYVAVYDGKVVDHGTDLQEIYDRLREKYPMKEYDTIVVKFVPEKDVKFLFASGSSAAPYAQPVVPAI